MKSRLIAVLAQHLRSGAAQSGAVTAISPADGAAGAEALPNNANGLIEKDAAVFAAEFIYPEAEFVADIGPLANISSGRVPRRSV